MSRPRDPLPNDYVRVSVATFDNPKLADIADEYGPSVYVVWLFLLCQAKKARHLGRVIASPVRVARTVGIDLRQATGILESLEACRAIVAVDDRAHHYQVRNWTTWQSMTPAERVRKHRNNVTQNDDTVTKAVTLKRQERRGEETKGEKNKPLVEQTSDLPLVKQVFEHWKQAFGKTANTVLDEKRKRRIRWALKTYGLDATLKSISGYAQDDWKDRSKHHDLTLLFRDADHFERGIALADKNAATDASHLMRVQGYA
jgi:hypothetical protein